AQTATEKMDGAAVVQSMSGMSVPQPGTHLHLGDWVKQALAVLNSDPAQPLLRGKANLTRSVGA
ncbi:MAG: hypothetical protein ICV54_15200, partial [Nostoc sp. C3-bin3]|nr:hypothetical protein [Nostoc sp. C3-bin3]